MLQLIADTHTHTVASGHAYSTLRENAEAAARAGLLFLANTDHTGLLPGAPCDIFFSNKRAFPKMLAGVHILHGCEVNIIDYAGGLDLRESILSQLEWVIASFHERTLAPASEAEHTRAWMEIAHNPHVDVIGHCGNGHYMFDYKKVLKEFARCGKIVEINTYSFIGSRNSKGNCTEIARLCKEYGVQVVVSSDAHSELRVGDLSAGAALLEEIGFPEELVLNADARRFQRLAEEKSGREFPLPSPDTP